MLYVDCSIILYSSFRASSRWCITISCHHHDPDPRSFLPPLAPFNPTLLIQVTVFPHCLSSLFLFVLSLNVCVQLPPLSVHFCFTLSLFIHPCDEIVCTKTLSLTKFHTMNLLRVIIINREAFYLSFFCSYP